MAATIKDVAREAGVSYATVSRALSGARGVSRETAKRVAAAAEKLNYSPNKAARMLVNRHSGMIGLILPDISNPFFAQLALGVTQSAQERGYQTLIFNSGWDKGAQLEQLRLMKESCVDGVLLKPCSDTEEDLCGFDGYELPLVLLNARGKNTVSVDVDHKQGGYTLTEHLIACGFKRIAFVGGTDTSLSSKLRFEGYLQALRNNGLEAEDGLKLIGGGFSEVCGWEGTKKLMSLPCPPDAVFCCTDMVALGALQFAAENNISVPKDLGICGFDGLSFGELYGIRLTTVDQDGARMSRLATGLLTDIIENGKPKAEHITLAPKLVVRSTTG